MATRQLQEEIERLRQLRKLPLDSAGIAILRKALKDRSNLMIAEAAKTAAEIRASELIPDLLHAYTRVFENPVKTDPKCWAKTAIVQTLSALEYEDSSPFVRGVSHVQMEPVWGGEEDSAGLLRSACILALPQCTDLRRSEIFRLLVDMLQDPAGPVRSDAVRAIEQMNGEEAQLLLRLKARLGDSLPEVTGRVFDAVLHLESDKGLVFVAEFLQTAGEEIRDEAALAIGSSRQPGAAEFLITTWNNTINASFRSVLLRAISSSRAETGLEFLLSLIREGSRLQARSAMEALELHSESADIQERTEKAIQQRQLDGLPSIDDEATRR